MQQDILLLFFYPSVGGSESKDSGTRQDGKGLGAGSEIHVKDSGTRQDGKGLGAGSEIHVKDSGRCRLG